MKTKPPLALLAVDRQVMHPSRQLSTTDSTNTGSQNFAPDHYVRIPLKLVRDRKLGRTDLVVFGIVRRMTELKQKKCFASNETIAGIAGIAISNTRRSLRKLEDRGYIKCLYRDSAKRNRLEIVVIRLSESPVAMSVDDNRDYPERAQRDIHIYKRDTDKEPSKIDLANPAIADLLLKFASINEVYGSGSCAPAQRRAMGRLLGRHSTGDVASMIEYVATHLGEAYFPGITSPAQLEEKWSTLDAKRRAQKKPSSAGNLLAPADPDKYKNLLISR